MVFSSALQPGDEKAPYSPGDVYQESKCAAEKEVLRYIKEKNIPAAIVRPCAIYGPGDMRLLKMFRMVAKRKFFILGSGKALFHMVYIDDLVDGFILCSQKKEAIGKVFIIGGEEYTTLNKLASLIANEFKVAPPKLHIPFLPVEILSAIIEFLYKTLKLKKEPPLYRRRVAFFKKNRAFSISKAKKILDYKPKYDLEKGIHSTAQWYLEHGYI